MVAVKYDIVIVGGGLVGSACAVNLLFYNSHLKILMIEQHEPDFANSAELDSRIYAISPRNLKHLNDLGVMPDFGRIGQIDSMIVHGNKNSQISFDAIDTNSRYLAKMVEYKNLHAALYARMLEFSNLEFNYGQIEGLGSDDHSAWLTINETKITTRLLIAADGGNSFVRQRMGIVTSQIDYYQSGVVANFCGEKNHNNVAYQWFLGDSILALLPLPDRHVSIVWSTNHPELLINASADELCQKVTAASQGVLGKLTLLTKARAFPLKLNLIDKCYKGRVVLIGDAFHTIHPLAGQGVNLGFGDAWALGNLVTKIGVGQISSVDFNRFNSSRLIEVRKMQMACHSLQRLFDNRNKTVDFLRNTGLNLVNSITPLKKLLISSAINY